MGCCCCSLCLRRLSWSKTIDPEDTWKYLSPEANELVRQAFHDLDPEKILDVHVHLVGRGTNNSGNYLHKNYFKCCASKFPYFWSNIKMKLFTSAANINVSDPDCDAEYTAFLAKLLRNFFPPDIRKKHPNGPIANVAGLAEVHDRDGVSQPYRTTMHISNKWVDRTWRKYPDVMRGVPSIHPYHKDCIQQVNSAYYRGARVIKWLPNSMGFDPSSNLCDRFYKAVASKHDLWILIHTGHEHSLNDAGYTFQEYGNPCHLRKPLNMGCKVIAAHFASDGTDTDLFEDSWSYGEQVPSFRLMLRLLKSAKYDGQLLCDISAMTTLKRAHTLSTLLTRPAVHDRLIYGSDFPFCAINMKVWLRKLVKLGLIKKQEVDPLREIYRINPLLSDFVRKRIMRCTRFGVDYKFNPSIFQRADLVLNTSVDDEFFNKDSKE